MYSITITVANSAKLVEVAKVLDATGVELGTVEASTEAPKAKTTKAKAETPAKVEAPKVEAKEEAPAKKEISEAEKAKLYEPVKAAALKLNKEKGRDILVRVLGAFGVKTAPELSVEQYPEFIDAAEQELMV